MAKATKVEATVEFVPLRDLIVIRRDEGNDRSAGGIYLPQSAKPAPRTGVVVSTGPGIVHPETGKLTPLTVKEGNRVMFDQYSGREIEVGEDKFLVMRESDLLGTIRDKRA